MASLKDTSITGSLSTTGAVTLSNYSAGFVKTNAQGQITLDTSTYATTSAAELISNKSTETILGTSNTLYPTQNAVKSYVDNAVVGGIVLQGDWNASTNVPDISGTTVTGRAWYVATAGNTNIGGIAGWEVGEMVVKSATGWLKLGGEGHHEVYDFNGRYGSVILTAADVTGSLGYTPYNSTNPGGYTTNTGTVTSVATSGTVSGLTLTGGTITTSGTITLGGTLSLTSANVTSGLGFTPYNSTNPSGYISSYTETDTLATVTARGATTSTGVGFNNWVNILNQNSVYWYNTGNGVYAQTYFDGTNWNITKPISGTSATFSSTIGASNFSGTSSGTNTGDQTNISGNSGTTTLAANSTLWNGYAYGGGYSSGTIGYTMVYNSTNARWEAATAAHMQSWLGLGSMAYVSTSSYLALSGGTMTGTLGFQQPVGLLFANGQYIKDNSGGGLIINSGAAVNINGTSVTINGSTAWHAGNLTNLNQLSNGPGYITSYSETDTLSSVTGRGASTSSNIVVGNISFQGVGGNSGQSAPGSDYRIYQAPGAWTHPYPDLNIAWHTGISIGAYSSYGGIRFYNNSDMVTETFSVGNGDNHIRVAYNLYVTGTVTGSNLSGTNTGDQTNISGNAGTVTHNSGRVDSAWYNVGWFAGNPSPAYSCDAVQIQSSTGTLKATSINAPSGYVSIGNPWGTANSAYFPNGITTAGGDNWIYGHTYVGNAPGNGNGHEFWSNGSSYHRSNLGTNGHGASARFIELQSAAGNFIPYSFESDRGNHSWGTVARFRINNGESDRPSLQFSWGGSDNRWNVGYCAADDNFRITQNMGYRNDNSTFDGWGTERFKIDTSGKTYIGGSLSVGTTYAGFGANIAGTVYVIGGQIYVNDGYQIQNTTGNAIIQFNTSSLAFTGNIAANSGISMGGQVLSFDQSGVRSWQVQATGGNLRFYSGDSAGTASFTMPLVGTSGDFGVQNNSSISGLNWNRMGVINASAGMAAFVGTYNGLSIVGGHNSGLSAWSTLYVNCVNDAGSGGAVVLAATASVGTNTILHAGNYGNYALPLSGGTMSGNIAMGGYSLSNVYQITHTNAAIKMFGNFHLDAFNGQCIYLQYYNQGATIQSYASIAMNGYSISGLNTVTATTFIGSLSGNASTATYATTAGSAPNGSNINNYYDTTAGNGYGFRFWNGSDSYKISMGASALYYYGPVTDYSIKTQMNDGDTGRGFTWGRTSYAPIAGLNSTSGDMRIAGTFTSSTQYITNGDNSGTLYGPNTSWGGYLYVGAAGNHNAGTTAQVISTDGNLHMDAGSSSKMIYLNYYSGMLTSIYGGLNMQNTYITNASYITSNTYLRAGTNVYTDANYGYGLVGLYASTVLQGIFAMGDSYKLTAGGAAGNLYGLAWSHPNAGGQAANLSSHGLLVMVNGTTYAAISDTLWVSSNLKAGGYLYLGGQSTYYLYNSANGIRSNNNLLADADIYLGTRGTWLSSWLDQAVLTSSGPTFADVYLNGWFRNNSTNTGLYNQANGNHFYSGGTVTWNITANGTSNVRLYFRATHESTIFGAVYGETGSIGFLANDGNWGLRVDASHNVFTYGTDLTVGNSTSSNIYMTDTDETTRRIHCNSGRIGFLNSASSWGAWCDNTGGWRTDFSMYATSGYFYGSGGARLGDMWSGAGLYVPSGAMVFGTESSANWVFSNGATTQAYFAGGDGNLWMRWAGDWLSNLLGAKAVHRSEGTDYVNYSRYVYNNGAYSGSGWIEPSDLGVRYANSAGSLSSMNISQFTNNSGYITTSSSINSYAVQSHRYHSNRDFGSGTLIVTSIDYAVTYGDPFILEITGNTYGSIIPWDIQYQGYIYADTIINHGGISNGTNITGLVAINYGGNLCFWFPRQTYWQGFNVFVYTAYGTYAINKVTSISDVAKPTTAKEVSLVPYQSLHSGNYNSYTPTLTGAGASGTWGISISGNAASASHAVYLSGADAYTNGSDGWWRSNGNCGWYNASYAVGIYATEGGMVRTYNGAAFTAAGGGFDSDLTLKDVITRDLSTHKIANDISVIVYTWKDKNMTQVPRFGYGAQELLDLIPEAVYITGDKYAVDYTQVHTVLIDENTKRIQKLEKEAEDHQNQILNLKAEIEILKQQS